jgi:hypothetical protein
MTFNAADPVSSGYSLVFGEDFTDISRFDINNEGIPGKVWYMDRQYWAEPAPPSSVTLVPDGLVLTDTIATCGLSGARGSPMLGAAWGGGAYFEAELMFDPDLVFIENGDWPAFYGLSWELAGDADQAAHKPAGYKHFGEIDFMEYGFFNHIGNAADYRFFWQTMHDWYGTAPYSGIQNNNVSAMSAGADQDIRGWHKYGCLWIAGAANAAGSVQAYFDGQVAMGPETTGLVNYPYGKGSSTPPSAKTAYSIFDLNHFAVVLQSSLAAPMTVRSVKVWQCHGVGTVVAGGG